MSVAFASQFTSSLPELLQQVGRSIIVSTYDTGQLILLRRQHGGGLNTHFVGLPKPMGMAVGRDSLAVGTGYQIREYRNMAAVAAKLSDPQPPDAAYMPRRVHITGDIDIHEMSYGDDEELWFANTRMSCLCTLDRAHSVVPRWRPPFISAYDVTDRCHLNGLAMDRGQPRYVSALGATDTAAGWRPNKVDGGLIMEVPSGKPVLENLSMPHSPRWYRDRLWFLESGHGRLSCYDPKTKQTKIVAELPGFTRGLDFIGSLAFIGLSQVRETNVFAGLPLTRRVAERHCGVWVVDIESGSTAAYIQFTGQVREIFAVQLLPALFPEVLDLEHPLVPSTYSLPDEALSSAKAPDPIQIALATASESRAKGALQVAIDQYEQILEQDPGNFTALLSLGRSYSDARRWSEARNLLEHALAAQPNHAEVRQALGRALAGERQWAEAIAQYQAAIDADRTFAQAYVDRGKARCKRGNFPGSWSDLEWRRQLPGFPTMWCSQPEWQGEEAPDKTVLVHTEPGLRDTIFFARFLPAVRERCARLVVLSSAETARLFESMNCVDDVWIRSSKLPSEGFDLHCPLNSAAVHLAATPSAQIAVPYLSPPSGVGKLPSWSDAPHPRVGVVWRRGNEPPADTLARWSSIFGLDCNFYSLQAAPTQEEMATLRDGGVIPVDASGATDDRPDRTAHFIAAMDLVIGVDDWPTQLAGALAKPVWFVLAPLTDWRWPDTDVDTAWYPTARLLHVDSEDPGEQVEVVRGALAEWLARGGS